VEGCRRSRQSHRAGGGKKSTNREKLGEHKKYKLMSRGWGVVGGVGGGGGGGGGVWGGVWGGGVVFGGSRCGVGLGVVFGGGGVLGGGG